jgi:hypothetical protein
MKKGSEQTPTIEIYDNKSLFDYIGRKSPEQLSEYEKGIKAQFNLKLKDIQIFYCEFCPKDADGSRINVGELLMMINKQYKCMWNTIPWGKMDEVKEWVINNHHKRILLLSKDYHYTIITAETGSGVKDYQDWYNNHERRLTK